MAIFGGSPGGVPRGRQPWRGGPGPTNNLSNWWGFPPVRPGRSFGNPAGGARGGSRGGPRGPPPGGPIFRPPGPPKIGDFQIYEILSIAHSSFNALPKTKINRPKLEQRKINKIILCYSCYLSIASLLPMYAPSTSMALPIALLS